MLRHSDQLNELAKALSAAQGVMEGASKDKTNPHFKSKYADLGSVWTAIREPLAKNGLSVVQLPYTDEQGRVYVSTMLMHSSGQWIETSYTLPATKQDAQGFGSAITYMKRYALTGMGVAPEDDDGEGAVRGANGNGHVDPLPPLQRPTQIDPNAAALAWARAATEAVNRLKTDSDLRKWEQSNEKELKRLKDRDYDAWSKLDNLIGDRLARLSPANA